MIQTETPKISKFEKIGEVILVPRILIRPFPDQPRKYFDEEKLKELAASIKAVGQLVPGQVREANSNGSPYKYELIDGQRRWHALAIADVSDMKVIVVNIKDREEQFLISVVANFGRAEHGPLEIANAIERFRKNGKTVSQVAEIFARSEPWVYQHLKVLQLVPEVQEMMSPKIPEDRRLLFSTALMLADVPPDLQKAIADQIVGGNLKLSQARNLIRRRAEKMGFRVGSSKRTPREDYENLCNLIRRMCRELEIFEEMPRSFFEKMFQFRDKGDHERVVRKMEDAIEKAKFLLVTIKRAERVKKK